MLKPYTNQLMKNVKILRALIGFFVGVNIVMVVFGLYAVGILYPVPGDFPSYINFLTVATDLVKQIVVLPCLILLFQAVHYFIKNGYFNNKSAVKLKFSGISLMVAAVFGFISVLLLRQQLIYAMNMESTNSIKWVNELPTLFILLLIGFGLYALSDFIRKGDAIERENELTI